MPCYNVWSCAMACMQRLYATTRSPLHFGVQCPVCNPCAGEPLTAQNKHLYTCYEWILGERLSLSELT